MDQNHVHELYNNNWNVIKTSVKRGKRLDRYHFQLNDGDTMAQIDRFLKMCYAEQLNAFKVNLSFGFILRHATTGEFRFFHPSNNVALLSPPLMISKMRDVDDLLEKIDKEDLIQYAYNTKPTSSWRVYKIVCVRIDVTKLPGTLLE